MDKTTPKDKYLTIRTNDEELMIIEARAYLAGVSRSDFVRGMIEKSWGNRLAKAHRPYVALAGSLLDISAKLLNIYSRESLHDLEKKRLLDTCHKLDNVLDQILERMALDQEAAISDNNEEETFE